MKSYFECIDELDITGAEIHQFHGAPDYAIHEGELELDYAMTKGSLLYQPENILQTGAGSIPEWALEFTASGRRGIHRYLLSREARLVLVQPYEVALRKSEVRKPVPRDDILIPTAANGVKIMPPRVLTVTGLRRLTADLAKFKEKSLLKTAS
jgi:hypothetical protein